MSSWIEGGLDLRTCTQEIQVSMYDFDFLYPIELSVPSFFTFMPDKDEVRIYCIIFFIVNFYFQIFFFKVLFCFDNMVTNI